MGTGSEPFSDKPFSDKPSDDEPFSDDELAEMAMAADIDAPVAEDAVPMSLYLATQLVTLPQWYMPPAIARVGSRWRTMIIISIVVALVLIDAWGLCSTYGPVTLA